jgi:hypothetical protein
LFVSSGLKYEYAIPPMPDAPHPCDHPHQQQINALVALVAALIGQLRVRGGLSEADVDRLLLTADSFLPETSEAVGLQLLALAGVASRPATR